MTNNLEHLLECARRGASPGSSGNEKNARMIVEPIMEGVIGLDADATEGIGELAKLIYDRGFQARNEIRVQIGPRPEDVHDLREIKWVKPNSVRPTGCSVPGRGTIVYTHVRSPDARRAVVLDHHLAFDDHAAFTGWARAQCPLTPPDRSFLIFRFRFGVCLQFFKVGDEFLLARQAYEIVADHLEGSFGWLASSPKVDQKACDDGTVTLNFDTVLAMADQMGTAKELIEKSK